MALIRWQPFQEMTTLQRQMDRLFDELVEARPGLSEFTSSDRGSWIPAVEVKDTGAEITLRAELPGLDAKDLDIHVTQKAVSIAGEHRHEQQTEEKGHFRSEFRYGKFRRVVPLPAQVQHDQVKAQLNDGILTLTLPKLEAEQHKVTKVTIDGSTAAPAVNANLSQPDTEPQPAIA